EIYVNGGHRSPFTTNWHDFGPRLGFAWQPMAKFVVRGGVGFYYGPSVHNVASAGTNSDGFSSQTFWDASCILPDGNTVYGPEQANGATPTPGVDTGRCSLIKPCP